MAVRYITEEDKNIFRLMLDKYIATQHFTLQKAYSMMIYDYYAEKTIFENDEKKAIISGHSQLPSYSQFRYWINKMNDDHDKLRKAMIISRSEKR